MLRCTIAGFAAAAGGASRLRREAAAVLGACAMASAASAGVQVAGAEAGDRPAWRTPGADRPYPPISSVPERPPRPDAGDRRRLLEELLRDRAEAARISAEIERRTRAEARRGS